MASGPLPGLCEPCPQRIPQGTPGQRGICVWRRGCNVGGQGGVAMPGCVRSCVVLSVGREGRQAVACVRSLEFLGLHLAFHVAKKV